MKFLTRNKIDDKVKKYLIGVEKRKYYGYNFVCLEQIRKPVDDKMTTMRIVGVELIVHADGYFASDYDKILMFRQIDFGRDDSKIVFYSGERDDSVVDFDEACNIVSKKIVDAFDNYVFE